MAPTKVIIGECEFCGIVNVALTLQHNDLMCAGCIERENAITSKIEVSRQIDSSIQSKAQIFNAPTVASIELKGLIQQNDSIPSNEKDFEYAREMYTRFKHAQEILFNKRKETVEAEKLVREMQSEVQVALGKLPGDKRAQFKELDINYQPVKPKSVKPAKTPTPSSNSASSRTEVNDAANKHGVLAAGIRFTMVAQNLSAESAAIFLKNQIEAGKARTAARLKLEAESKESN